MIEYLALIPPLISTILIHIADQKEKECPEILRILLIFVNFFFIIGTSLNNRENISIVGLLLVVEFPLLIFTAIIKPAIALKNEIVAEVEDHEKKRQSKERGKDE